MKRKTLIISVLLLIANCFLPTFSSAQENCNNCIDDDGDGLIDCYDPQCADSISCSTFFIKANTTYTNCITFSAISPSYTIYKAWTSQAIIDSRFTTIVGDIDGDAMPEVVAMGVGGLQVLDGLTGNVKVTINCPPTPISNDGVAIGDIDKDGDGEIFVVTQDGLLRSFDHTGTALWVSPITMGGAGALSDGASRRPGLVNFNGDDTVEVYVGNKIFNAQTGRVIAEGSGSSVGSSSGGWAESHPVAADVLPPGWIDPSTGIACPDCDGIELICGNEVYGVVIPGNTMTLRASIASFGDGYTSIADFNGDDSLDVIVVESGFRVSIWDPRKQTQIGTTFTSANNGSGGRANVGNFDTDPELEIGVAGRDRYVLIDNDMTQKWERATKDHSSTSTGSSAFDFDCDGDFEIVYRDEENLFIFDGATGAILAQSPCKSLTRTELPVVVDVDADGQANIVCTCYGTANTPSHAVAWNSLANNWPPTRTVWNQHGYNATNINDDLTIPCVPQNNAATGLPDRLNSFLHQMPLMDELGNPQCFINLLDVTISIDSIIGNACDDSVQVNVTICNLSDKLVPGLMPVSFYKNDPLVNGTRMRTVFTNRIIYPHACESFSYSIDPGFYPVHAYVNDHGNTPGSAPDTKYPECDKTNNFDLDSVKVHASPTVYAGADRSVCSGTKIILSATAPNDVTYSWNTGEIGPSISGNVTNTFNYIVTVTDTIGCSKNDSVMVLVYLSPAAAATAAPLNGCTPLEVTFTSGISSSYTIVSCSWDFGDGTGSSSCNSVAHVYSVPGTYSVSLIVQDANGCIDTSQSMQINVYPNPTASFSFLPEAATIIDPTIRFTDSSIYNISSWLWSFGDTENGLSSLRHPDYSYTDTGTYIVRLIVSDTNGCKDTTERYLYISSDYVFFAPNSFTPNNDGINDVFLPQTQVIIPSTYYFMVFDRWGNKIFQTNDYKQGWNGTNPLFGEVQQDVYIWNVTLSDFNNLQHHYTGRITVVR